MSPPDASCVDIGRRHPAAEAAITAQVAKTGVVQNHNNDIRRASRRAGEPRPTGDGVDYSGYFISPRRRAGH